MKINRFIVISGLIIFFARPLFAYTDRVDAAPQEIFDAAKICFAKEGIYKQDPQKLTLTTSWIYTRIRRTRKPQFVPIQLAENFDVRYQLSMTIEKQKNYTEVSFQGRFEEKKTDAPPQQHWQSSHSSKELYFKEREAFFRVLKVLEEQKKATPQPAST